MNSRAQTWNQLLEKRTQTLFIGRQREQELFRLNFMYQIPEYLLFAIHGPAGIGKSTLLARYRASAEEHGATTVQVGTDQATTIRDHTILRTLTHLARQLAANNTQLTTFDERYKVYGECMDTIATDTDAPAGVFDLLDGLNQPEEAQLNTWATYLDEKLLTPDQIELIKNPVETLTRAFMQDLSAWATVRQIILCFDDWEQLSPHLNTWLIDALAPGTLNTNVWVIIAGENPLDDTWQTFRPVIVTLNLQTFTAAETRAYLSATGIHETDRVSNIWNHAKGSPMLVSLLASADGHQGNGLAINPLDRYLKWLDAPWKRETALYCAAARQLNTDVVTATIGGNNTATLFDWLTQTPLVLKHGESWIYHSALRSQLHVLAHQQAPEAFQTAHANLHSYYEQQLTRYESETAYRDPQWRKDKLECLYHGLMSGNTEAEREGIETFLLTLRAYYPLASEIVATWEQAATEQATPNTVTDWAQTLSAGWRALEERDWGATHEFCDLVTQRRDLSYEAQDALYALHELAAAQSAKAVPPKPAHKIQEKREPEAAASEATQVIQAKEPPIKEPEEVDALTEPHDAKKIESLPSESEPEASDIAFSINAETAPAESALEDETPQKEEPVAEEELVEESAASEKSTADMTKESAAEPAQEPTTELAQEPAVVEDVSEETTADTIEVEAEAEPESETPTTEAAQEKEVSVTKEQSIPEPETLAENDIDAADYNNRANVYLSMGEYQKAIRDYTKAVELDPAYTVAYFNRALAFTQLKGFDRALNDYTKTIELNPNFAAAYKNRGVIYANIRQYEQAIEDYSRAIAFQPDDAVAYNNRGNAHYNLNAYPEAIEDYDRAIEFDSNFTRAYLNRGLAYGKQEEYQQAIADYNQVILLNPGNAIAYNYRGQAYAKLEQYGQAISDYEKALEVNPKYAIAHNNRGLALVKQGKHAQAIEAYQYAIELNPKLATAHYNAACAAAMMGDIDDACKWLEKAIALHPKYEVMAKHDKDFDNVRHARKFRTLIEK